MGNIRIGEVIDNRYRIGALLGEGGFGVVYKATQTSTGQPVAVKFLLKERLIQAKDAWVEMARFEREMQLIAQLKHPNVVRLIDSGITTDWGPYMVLEFIEGKTLHDVLEAEGRLAPDEAAQLMFQVLDALSCAHRHGIIHRDLKPQNIMLLPTGFRRNAMVLDFGIGGILKHARDLNYVSLTAESEVRGTPSYMAPEQLRQEELNEQVDLYAWGLLFIETLTGRRAIEGSNPFETALMQADTTPVAIPSDLSDPTLRGIIARAVSKPKAERYASADDALRDLQQWMGGATSRPSLSGDVAAAPVASDRALAARASTRPGWLIAAAAIVAVGVVAALIYAMRPGAGPPAADKPAAAEPGCTRPSDCASGEVCSPAGECVRWRSEYCSTLEGPLGQDNVVMVGTIGPTDRASYLPREQAVRLAIGEINDAGGLPGGRRLVLVGCNDGGVRQNGLAAARHLVDNLGVVALVGPAFSSIFIDIVTEVTRPAGVLAISGAATSPAISQLDDDDLAWRTIPSDVEQADALVQLAVDRGYRHATILAKSGAYGGGLLDRVSAGLLEHLDDVNAVSYPEVKPDLRAIVPNAFRPDVDVVFIFGTSEVTEVLGLFEQEVVRRGSKPPAYILSESARRPELLVLYKNTPALAGRIEVVGPEDRNGAIYDAFALRFAAAHGQRSTVGKLGNAYDAAYVMALAIAALGDGPISGRAASAAIARLVAGEHAEVGPRDVGRVMRILADGGQVNLEGASGALDFDLSTGDVPGQSRLWRVLRDPQGAPAFAEVGAYAELPDGKREWTLTGPAATPGEAGGPATSEPTQPAADPSPGAPSTPPSGP